MKMSKYMTIIVLLILLGLVFTGCGTKDSGQTPAPIADNQVIMKDHAFVPAEITVKKGDTVTWINKDSAKHDVTGDSFKSELLAKDQTFEQTFNEVGTFEYSCTPHPYMKGKVIVTE